MKFPRQTIEFNAATELRKLASLLAKERLKISDNSHIFQPEPAVFETCASIKERPIFEQLIKMRRQPYDLICANGVCEYPYLTGMIVGSCCD